MAPRLSSPVGLLVAQGGGPDLREVRVRRATAADTGALSELAAAPSAVEDHLLVEHLGRVIAGIGVRRTDDGAHLHDLAVDRVWRGMGLGRLLVAAALLVLDSEGTAEARVEPGEARDWFTALGFTEAAPGLLRRETALGGHDLPGAAGRLAALQVDFQRSGARHEWDPGATALLQFARRRGVKTESLCWAGVCGTCSVKIACGTVTYDDEPGLDPDDGKVLLCITRPLTDLVLDL